MNSIVDMDGFYVNGKFYCKELGLIKIGNSEASSFFFDIGLRWNKLSDKDKNTCNHVKKKIHKLNPFRVPRGTKALQITNLSAVVEDFYRKIRDNFNSSICLQKWAY